MTAKRHDVGKRDRAVPAEFSTTKFKLWRPSYLIRRLNAPGWLKRELLKCSKLKVRFGKREIAVGKKIVELVVDFHKRFPHTCLAAIFFAVLTLVASQVPFVGWLLWPLVAAAGLLSLVVIGTVEGISQADTQRTFGFLSAT